MMTQVNVQPPPTASSASASDLVVAPEGGGVLADLVDTSQLVRPTGLSLPIRPRAGGADKFVDNNGPVLQVMQLLMISWGNQWTGNPPPTPTSDQATAACRTIMRGPHLAGLAQYRGIGRGFFRGSAV